METTGTESTNPLAKQPAEPALTDLKRLPPFKRNHKQEIALQIAQHLSQLLQRNYPDTSASMKIPSALSLCGFYGCTPLDVLDGLYAFRQKNYEYMMSGLDSEIILHSHPHFVKTRSRLFGNGPWDLTHKIAESPLINLFQGKAG